MSQDLPIQPSAPAQQLRPATLSAQQPRYVLEPSQGWMKLNLRSVWDYRELLYFLVWRDLKVRYKQTALGVAWALLQPLVTMVVFSIFFGAWSKIPSDGIPYPLFAYAALLPWQLFANAVAASGNSLVMNQQLITKVYFPRLIVPLAAVLVGLVDLALGLLVLLGMMLYFGIYPTVAILALPLLMIVAMATALAVGLWLSALNVQYRDVQYTIPFLVQLWLFLTPIAYPVTIVPPQWRALYALNPLVGVVEGFRWALLGKNGVWEQTLIISLLATVLLLIGGLFYFRRMESTFADVV